MYANIKHLNGKKSSVILQLSGFLIFLKKKKTKKAKHMVKEKKKKSPHKNGEWAELMVFFKSIPLSCWEGQSLQFWEPSAFASGLSCIAHIFPLFFQLLGRSICNHCWENVDYVVFSLWLLLRSPCLRWLYAVIMISLGCGCVDKCASVCLKTRHAPLHLRIYVLLGILKPLSFDFYLLLSCLSFLGLLWRICFNYENTSIEGNNTHWGLPEGEGREEGEDQEKN